MKELFNHLDFLTEQLEVQDRIFNYFYYMTEHGWPLRQNYFTEYELKRIPLIDDELLKNPRKTFKTDKLIVGGLLLVRMLIMDLIFKKQFEENENTEYSNQAQKNFHILGSFLYIIFSHYIKEHTS